MSPRAVALARAHLQRALLAGAPLGAEALPPAELLAEALELIGGDEGQDYLVAWERARQDLLDAEPAPATAEDWAAALIAAAEE